MKNILYSIAIILMPFVFTACMFNVHYTAYIKDNIKAVGGRFMQREYATFYYVSIGFIDRPQKGTQAIHLSTFSQSRPKFAIKLKDNTMITSDEMTYDKINSLPNVMTCNSPPMKGTAPWLFIDGYEFHFINNEIIYFATRNHFMHNEYNPMIGDINGKQFYTFPITQEQLESIFGTPDKYVNDYRH